MHSQDMHLFLDELCCELCEEMYQLRDPRCPKLLPCAHTFCGQCLVEWAGVHGTSLSCPTCRQPCDLPPAQLPMNFALVHIIQKAQQERCGDDGSLRADGNNDDVFICHPSKKRKTIECENTQQSEAPTAKAEQRTISQVLEEMRQDSEDPAAQANACRMLQKQVSKGDRNRQDVAKSWGIGTLLYAMKKHKLHCALQEAACGVLAQLALQETCRERLGNEGGVETLVETMHEHQGSAEILASACLALHNLSPDKENKKKLVVSGGIGAVVDAMTSHCNDQRIALQAICVLLNLALVAENKEKIRRKGGIGAIVTAMQSHIQSETVQSHGCWALLNLAANHQSNRTKISAEGGIPATVAAMRSFPDSVTVQEYACALLASLAMWGGDSVRIADVEGIGLVIGAMGRHRGVESVQRRGCGALMNLAQQHANHEQMIKEGGVRAIIDAIISHGDSAPLLERGAGAMQYLAGVRAGKLLGFVMEEVLGVLVHAMRRQKSHVGVQHRACAALNLLAGDTVNHLKMLRKGVIGLVVIAMKAHTSHAGLQEEGCQLLMCLADSSAQNKAWVAREGGLEAILFAMNLRNVTQLCELAPAAEQPPARTGNTPTPAVLTSIQGNRSAGSRPSAPPRVTQLDHPATSHLPEPTLIPPRMVAPQPGLRFPAPPPAHPPMLPPGRQLPFPPRRYSPGKQPPMLPHLARGMRRSGPQ